MSNYTEHYNLKKPLKTESYDVDVANTNNDIIDEKIYEKVDKIVGKDLSSNDFTNEYKKKIDSLQTLYRFKGSVETFEELQQKQDNTLGDVWNCKEDNKNYCWNKEEWIDIGIIIDLSSYYNKSEVDTKVNSTKEHKYHLNITTAVENMGQVTLPFYYKVGSDCLDVFYMGERLIKNTSDVEGHYNEVGDTGSVSNKIQVGWKVNIGRYFDFVVRGDYSA